MKFKRILPFILLASLFTNVLLIAYIDYKNEKEEELELEIYNMFHRKYLLFAEHFLRAAFEINDEIEFIRARDHMNDLIENLSLYPDQNRHMEVEESLRTLVQQIEKVRNRFMSGYFNQLDERELSVLQGIALNYHMLIDLLYFDSFIYHKKEGNKEELAKTEKEIVDLISHYVKLNDELIDELEKNH